MCPHRPATWAGSRAGPPVSECVSPVRLEYCSFSIYLAKQGFQEKKYELILRRREQNTDEITAEIFFTYGFMVLLFTPLR
jgi:hypothetical protein